MRNKVNFSLATGVILAAAGSISDLKINQVGSSVVLLKFDELNISIFLSYFFVILCTIKCLIEYDFILYKRPKSKLHPFFDLFFAILSYVFLAISASNVMNREVFCLAVVLFYINITIWILFAIIIESKLLIINKWREVFFWDLFKKVFAVLFYKDVEYIYYVSLDDEERKKIDFLSLRFLWFLFDIISIILSILLCSSGPNYYYPFILICLISIVILDSLVSGTFSRNTLEGEI